MDPTDRLKRELSEQAPPAAPRHRERVLTAAMAAFEAHHAPPSKPTTVPLWRRLAQQWKGASLAGGAVCAGLAAVVLFPLETDGPVPQPAKLSAPTARMATPLAEEADTFVAAAPLAEEQNRVSGLGGLEGALAALRLPEGSAGPWQAVAPWDADVAVVLWQGTPPEIAGATQVLFTANGRGTLIVPTAQGSRNPLAAQTVTRPETDIALALTAAALLMRGDAISWDYGQAAAYARSIGTSGEEAALAIEALAIP